MAIICADQLFDQVFEKLGRGTLILRLPGPRLPSIKELKATIDAFEPTAAAVVLTISNRSKSHYAPLMPYDNFQCLGNHHIAAEIQNEPHRFSEILDEFHSKLYRSNFVNSRKRSIRGAYMLDNETAFQEDRLHSIVQTIGTESRTDGFHLINAFHAYGVKIDPGFHFDVMNEGGGAIGHVLSDVLSHKMSEKSDTHLNATPCGRLL